MIQKIDDGQIIGQLYSVQFQAVDIGGYYLAGADKTKQAMRSGAKFNQALAGAVHWAQPGEIRHGAAALDNRLLELPLTPVCTNR